MLKAVNRTAFTAYSSDEAVVVSTFLFSVNVIQDYDIISPLVTWFIKYAGDSGADIGRTACQYIYYANTKHDRGLAQSIDSLSANPWRDVYLITFVYGPFSLLVYVQRKCFITCDFIVFDMYLLT